MTPIHIVHAGDTDGLTEALADISPDPGGIEVPLLALRQALLAIRPHAAGPKGAPDLQTVRITPGPDHCHVTATDGYTMALAAVPTRGLSTVDLDPIDLHPDDVVKILAVFRMPADKDTWPSCTVRLEPRGSELSVVDCGGLFDGQELTVPAHRAQTLPDVAQRLGQALSTARALAYPPGTDRGLSKSTVEKLVVACKTYDNEPAWVQPVSADPKAAHLVIVGPSFIAIAAASTLDDDEQESSWSPVAWRRRWAEALPRTERATT